MAIPLLGPCGKQPATGMMEKELCVKRVSSEATLNPTKKAACHVQDEQVVLPKSLSGYGTNEALASCRMAFLPRCR